jgi:hypothetical protein
VTTFAFHAELVVPEAGGLSLSFADRSDDQRHYLVLARDEETPDQAQPDLRKVYIECDDQCWGGYGGIESVQLQRDALTIQVGEKMATKLGLHDVLCVSFSVDEVVFREVQRVVHLIFRGYEDRVQFGRED